MRRKRNTFRLGLTLIVMFVLLVACLVFIGSKGLQPVARTEFTVMFEPGPAMPELTEGSFVTCFGQKVGQVVSTSIVPFAPEGESPTVQRPFLEVHATADKRLDLRSDCRVIASGPPLGGKGVLEIVSRGTADQALTPDTRLFGRPAGFQAAVANIASELDVENPQALLVRLKSQLDPADRASIVAGLQRSIKDINAITASLADDLDRNREDRLLYKVHAGLNHINETLAQIEALVSDNRPRIDHTLTSLDHALTVVDEDVVRSVADELNAGREGALLARAHDALARLESSMEDINVITSDSRRVVVLNSDRVDELVANVTEASMTLKTGIKDLWLHPWKLLEKPTSQQQRELYIFGIAREMADAAAHLDDASTRLKALAQSNGGVVAQDDPDLVGIRSDLKASFDKFSAVEKALLREMDVK